MQPSTHHSIKQPDEVTDMLNRKCHESWALMIAHHQKHQSQSSLLGSPSTPKAALAPGIRHGAMRRHLDSTAFSVSTGHSCLGSLQLNIGQFGA